MITNPAGCKTRKQDYIIERDDGRDNLYFSGAMGIDYDNRGICGTRCSNELLDELTNNGSTVTFKSSLGNLKGAQYLRPGNMGIVVTVWKSVKDWKLPDMQMSTRAMAS